MASFDDYNGALEIFKQVGCVGKKDNWIFGGFIDKSKSAIILSSTIGRYTFGAAGQMAGYAIGREKDLKISKVNGYFALLFNFTENGIGIMPLEVLEYLSIQKNLTQLMMDILFMIIKKYQKFL